VRIFSLLFISPGAKSIAQSIVSENLHILVYSFVHRDVTLEISHHNLPQRSSSRATIDPTKATHQWCNFQRQGRHNRWGQGLPTHHQSTVY